MNNEPDPHDRPLPSAPSDQPETPDPRPGHEPGTGRFLQGHTSGNLKHGAFSRRAQDAELPGQEQLRAAIAERRIEWITDLGELSFGERDLVNRGLRLHVILDTLEANMERDGVLTSKGSKRAAVTLYLAVLDRLTRLYQQLGLERRQKRVETIASIVGKS